MADIAFALNYTNLYLIDITPEEDEPTWARVGAGINKADFDGNEESDNDPYYDGDGMANTEVTGGQLSISFSGHRKYGDPAQDYVAGLQVQYGAKRHTNFRRIAPDGQVTEGDVTISNIKAGGGDPNKKGDFGFDVRFNGMPAITEGDASSFPEALALEAVTVQVGNTVALAPTVTPTTANAACVYGVKDDAVAKVDAAGNLTGVKEGTTKVSIKSAVLPSVRIEVDVTVEQPQG